MTLLYRYFHGECASEIRDLIGPLRAFNRQTRFSRSAHRSHVNYMAYRPTHFQNGSSFSRTTRLWNTLPANVLPNEEGAQFAPTVEQSRTTQISLGRTIPFCFLCFGIHKFQQSKCCKCSALENKKASIERKLDKTVKPALTKSCHRLWKKILAGTELSTGTELKRRVFLCNFSYLFCQFFVTIYLTIFKFFVTISSCPSKNISQAVLTLYDFFIRLAS